MSLGQSGRVVFEVRSPIGTRIASVTADLLGDGEPGWTVTTTDNGARIAGIRYTPTRRGKFNLVVTAIDACGELGETRLQRDVRVQ